MPLQRDDDAFDERQACYSYEMIATIHQALTAAGLPPDQARQLTGDVAFALAAQLDGITPMEYDGQRIRPVLTFAPDTPPERESHEEPTLLYSGTGSALHEYVYGNLDEIAPESDAG
jgi:hypothetical protein